MKQGEIILVVAPEGGLRRSYEFALQAGGFAVEVHASVSSAASRHGGDAICALVDDGALKGPGVGRDPLGQLGIPVVVLLSGFGDVPSRLDGPGEILTKPLRGNELFDSIERLRKRATR